ncbi:MAG: stage III sporulation protein AF [Clostridia bacterium]|nr:stage III sporulation protein AF [Clostridia bacterium]
MMEWVKEWANSLLCLGIFTAIVEMVLPKGNIKKYIYVIIGIVTILVIISPFISKTDYENLAIDAVETISKNALEIKEDTYSKEVTEEFSKYQESMVREEYVNNLKKSIWNDLTSKGVILDKVEISINDDYNVGKLEIVVKEYSKYEYTSSQDIMKYIENYYDIAKENVVINDEVGIYGK